MENSQKTNNDPRLINQNVKKEGEVKQERRIIIHSMPKRFLRTRIIPASTKGVGMAILIFGTILLLGVLAAAYFFVLKPRMDAELVVEDYFPEESASDLVENINNELPEEEKEIQEQEEAEAIPENPENNNNQILNPEITETEITASGTESETEEELREIVIDPETGTSSSNSGNTVDDILYAAALDSDSDGLSDLEEMLLDTNLQSVDSDGDGYGDLDELKNMYNPAGSGKIIVNPNIEKYTNNTYGYSLYYPLIWLRTNVDGDDSILFQAGNNQYVQVIVQANPGKNALRDWYKEQLNVADISNSQIMYKPGWEGIKSEDGLIAYLTKPSGSYIYIISYNTGIDRVLRFKNIFDMIVASFEVAD